MTKEQKRQADDTVAVGLDLIFRATEYVCDSLGHDQRLLEYGFVRLRLRIQQTGALDVRNYSPSVVPHSLTVR
jgi:hypothetical protein